MIWAKINATDDKKGIKVEFQSVPDANHFFSKSEKNLTNTLEKYIKKETTVMMMGLTPVKETQMPFAGCLWYSNKACSNYERIIEECCLEHDIPFLPTYQEMMNNPSCINWIMEDGIHLNSSGHKWIFKKVLEWKSLESRINS